jgi:hypothetical protein
MAIDRIHLNDAEEAWIAKYRAALKEIPVQQPRSTRVRDALNRVHGIAASHIGRILATSLDASLWKRSVQSSEPLPAPQPQSSVRNLSQAESSAKVA